MNPSSAYPRILTAVILCVLIAGCSGRSPTEIEDLDVARAPVDPVVFDDDWSEIVYFQPFFETHYLAVERDSVFAYNGFAPDGARSLKITVPPIGSALGPYAGGVFTSVVGRDITDFNALTFYARSDRNIQLNVAGFGNDNTGTSRYEAGRANVPLTGDWTFVVVPIPDSSRLTAERGLFTFAEGAEEQYPEGYHIWIDEIRYAKLDNIEVFRPTMDSGPRQYFIGSTVAVTGTRTVFLLDGAFVFVNHMPGYYSYTASNPSVTRVTDTAIEVIGEGQSDITATLLETDVFGIINVFGYEPPSVAAAAPALPAENVISMFSDAYDDVSVDTWDTGWGGSNANVEDYEVAGDVVKMYTNLNFVGIEFLNPTIDASEMTHFHLDVYAPAGSDFKVKLVSFPPDLSGSVETQDLVLDAESTPAFAPGGWVSLDIPLENFQVPENWSWGHVGQLVLSTGSAQLVLVDNVYWHR